MGGGECSPVVGAVTVSSGAKTSLARAGLVALSAVVLLLVGAPVEAQPFNQFIGFGDSTLDSGWYFTHTYNKNPINEALYQTAQALGGGVATTPGGRMNSQILAGMFGLSATPVGLPGGTNYAAGGATNIDYANYQTLAPNTVSQIQSYLASTNGVANPNALYMISSGGNDIRGAICAGGVCPANAAQLASNSANALSNAIAQLHAAGARYFVVAINYGAGPQGAVNADVAATIRTYDQTLYGGLAAAGVNFVPVSGRAIADAIGVDPGRFGLTNVTPGSAVTHQGGACVNPAPGNGNNGTIASAWAASCTTLVAPNAAQTYLYADDLHYSAAGQLIEGSYAYSLIVAPTEMSYLAEAPVVTRRTVVESVLSQIPISQWQRTLGSYNAWISGSLSSLSMTGNWPGFPGDPGTPGMVTAGVDYLLTPNWLVGAAVSIGTTRQSFSLGGDFRQNEYAVSAYAAYAGGPLWLDMIASYGGLRYDSNRIVPIGITTISNTSSTSGDNPSFAAEVGYNFTTAFGQGAAAGITNQSARHLRAGADARAGRRHSPAADFRRRICRDRSVRRRSVGRVHGADLRQSAARLCGHRARLSGGPRPRHLASLRQARVESRTRLDQPPGDGDGAGNCICAVICDAGSHLRQGLGDGYTWRARCLRPRRHRLRQSHRPDRAVRRGLLWRPARRQRSAGRGDRALS